ncbi:L,D-transpeptidase family protein [Sphingosinicella humi]|uniref:L,D-transpeptidase family protein n=1 Tax=Allosphingosinicella humi TaxID=2068657 RepID=UPI001FB15DE6|nr:L,D-transpeptidase family protein [Sphingosinicella humi]
MRDRKLLAALLCSLAVVAAAPLAGAAVAQNETGGSPQREDGGIDGTIFHAQVLLDRAGFAPGVIDGKKGMSFEEAVKGFQTSRGLKVTGVLDTPTRRALLTDKAPSTRRLRIDESDAQGPFVGSIPDDPAEQAKMERLGYRNLLEKIAEKFHTTPATIIALNRPDMVLRAGTVLRLPNVLPSSRDYGEVPAEAAKMLSDLNVSGDLPKAERIVVDKSDGVLRLYGEGDRLLAQFPATMGSTHDPLPLGNWKVTSIAYNPPFHYQPELFWDVADDEDEQRLPPGPNGPVGVVWIDISKENYGIHGTSAPETIQRAQSHGCVRLTNWDAARVSQMASDGMPVIFQA